VDGLTVAIDLCTGYQRFSLGRPVKGALGPPNPGESHGVSIEVQPGGLFVFGQYIAKGGMNIDVRTNGALHLGLTCADQADLAADAFVHGRASAPIRMLTEADLRGGGHLRIGPTGCKVAVVARA